ncbi:adenosylmethionine decarboxylase [Pseudomonas sp. RP23018S]|uniref:adenosylmethionine decarboxylase n=1 Tax=Pseudomonas sp. RP23018S TaxID=3096037 RepID=UPI002ACA2DFE|nr:adenosylmethionine decarboxylase [Pseudomonas sp. RP23018S]MDZ5602015.1 adenosylmethionine decarboxylase [Pseudomonas sp. RP23018S]
MNDTGFHTLWDINGAPETLLQDAPSLHTFFRSILVECGFTVIDDLVHKFDAGGGGVTGLFLLSESHLSYHTYPETYYISIDIYTCGRANNVIDNEIYEYFDNATAIHRRRLARGTLSTSKSGAHHEAN